jgi:hypothetical protein
MNHAYWAAVSLSALAVGYELYTIRHKNPTDYPRTDALLAQDSKDSKRATASECRLACANYSRLLNEVMAVKY